MAFTGPLSKIELRLSAHNLVNLDILSKSDPQAHVHLKTKTGQWVEIGRTEMINDNLNPSWVTPVVVGMCILHSPKLFSSISAVVNKYHTKYTRSDDSKSKQNAIFYIDGTSDFIAAFDWTKCMLV